MQHQLIFAVGAALVVCGCAHGPRMPLPAQTPGTTNIIVTGTAESIAAFSQDPRIPQNCVQKASGQGKSDDSKAPRSKVVQLTYRCQNTTPDTFRAFGEVYFAVLNQGRRVKAASLEPVLLGQATDPALAVHFTTTDCIIDACYTGVQYPWMPPAGACTDLCY